METEEGGFQLTNDSQRVPRWCPDPPEKQRQKVLLSGMDCLPDQQNLFETDGDPPDEPTNN